MLKQSFNLPLCLFIFFLGLLPETHAQPREVEVFRHGDGQWELRVEGEPFLVKGVVYNFFAVGDDPAQKTLRDWSILDTDGNGRVDVAYDSWVDVNLNNRQDEDEMSVGDWQLLRDMGCNTLRLYQMPSADERIEPLYREKGINLTFFHPPNKALFRDLYEEYGIMVVIGHFFGEWGIGSGALWEQGTDYTDPEQRKNLLACIRVMVEEHKDEPYTLLWMLGNENFNPEDHDNAEQQVEAFLTLVNEAAVLIHELDPNHPVALCNWGMANLAAFGRYCPDVDIFGINSYLKEFTPVYERVKKEYDRPVLITEYGFPSLGFNRVDEDAQAAGHQSCWMSIEANRYGGEGVGNSIGGTAFIWCDQWGLTGAPDVHDEGSMMGMKGIEWYGLTSQGDGSKSPFLRQLRKVYYRYKEWWGTKMQKSEG